MLYFTDQASHLGKLRAEGRGISERSSKKVALGMKKEEMALIMAYFLILFSPTEVIPQWDSVAILGLAEILKP